VGAVAVLGAQRWGAGARVEFLCGGRVIRALSAARAGLACAAGALRCAPGEVGEAARRVVEESRSRRKEADRLLAELARLEALRLAAGGGLVRAVLAPPAGGAAGWLKAVASVVAELGGTALLGAVEDGRALVCFARPGGPGPSMGDLVRAAAAALGGKGGGAPDLGQGGGPEVAGLAAALAAAEAALRRG
jgi:alanyl-tRNA synthetase